MRSGWSHGAEKESLRIGCQGPYRKPTQAGGLRKLRRTGELALRNSAKCTRNFGRSVAFGGEVCSDMDGLAGGCREKAQATVYQKHRSLLISDERYRD